MKYAEEKRNFVGTLGHSFRITFVQFIEAFDELFRWYFGGVFVKIFMA